MGKTLKNHRSCGISAKSGGWFINQRVRLRRLSWFWNFNCGPKLVGRHHSRWGIQKSRQPSRIDQGPDGSSSFWSSNTIKISRYIQDLQRPGGAVDGGVWTSFGKTMQPEQTQLDVVVEILQCIIKIFYALLYLYPSVFFISNKTWNQRNGVIEKKSSFLVFYSLVRFFNSKETLLSIISLNSCFFSHLLPIFV